MKNAAAITASLVDMRNVGTLKVLKLTLHVPEEEALKAIAAFGWPTGVNPVPVAIAHLNTNSGAAEPPRATEADPRNEDGPVARPRRLPPLSQRAGMLCNDPAFWAYLTEKHPDRCRLLNEGTTSEKAALIVRSLCNVQSRSDIKDETPAGDAWLRIEGDYQLWMKFPEYAL